MIVNTHLLTVPANVGGRPTEEVQAELGLETMIQLGSNENAFGPSPLALAAFQDALKEAHRYPGTADRDLRRKLAAHYNACDGAALEPGNFLTGNGLSDVLRMIAHAFLFGQGKAIYCNPTFPLYALFTRMFGATPIAVPHAHYEYNLPAIADAIDDNTRVVFICNPNNPTGTIVTRAQVDEFMARVPSSVVVVFDEAYYDFVDDPAYSNSIEYLKQGQENVIVLRGFSKVYGLANLRIGYAIAAPAMIDYLAHAQIVFNTSDAVLRAASAALDDKAHIESTRRLVSEEREFLYRGLKEQRIDHVPSNANFILLTNLPCPAQVIDSELLQRGVMVRRMGGFGMPDALRVTVGRHAENENFLAALGQVLESQGVR